jgi:hypothetical protein
MIAFVERLYEETKWGDLGQLLSEISFTVGDQTGDPGSWAAWTEAVDSVLNPQASGSAG